VFGVAIRQASVTLPVKSSIMKRLAIATLTLGLWLAGAAADDKAHKEATPIPAA
jgi:hypothetical protein